MKSKCCEKYKSKCRFCSSCPCHKELSKKVRKKLLKKASTP